MIRPLRFAACALALAGLSTAHAQTTPLQEAVRFFESAEYQQAVDLLVSLADNPATTPTDRVEALQYLGRAYVAQQRMDQAREAIDQLFSYEPPTVEFDPEIEHPQLIELYYAARHDQQGGYGVEGADPGLQTLAVLDFTNTSITRHDEVDPLRQGFASMTIQYLRGATGLRVIERERIEWLLGELELQREGGVVDPSSAVRAGRLLGATAVLFGAYTFAGDQLWISARLVRVETGEILLAEQKIGPADNFFGLVEGLSVQVAQSIDATLDAEDVGENRDTESLDAMLAFSRALALREQGDLAGARAQLTLALEADPTNVRAQRMRDAMEPYLAAGN